MKDRKKDIIRISIIIAIIVSSCKLIVKIFYGEEKLAIYHNITVVLALLLFIVGLIYSIYKKYYFFALFIFECCVSSIIAIVGIIKNDEVLEIAGCCLAFVFMIIMVIIKKLYSKYKYKD